MAVAKAPWDAGAFLQRDGDSEQSHKNYPRRQPGALSLASVAGLICRASAHWISSMTSRSKPEAKLFLQGTQVRFLIPNPNIALQQNDQADATAVQTVL